METLPAEIGCAILGWLEPTWLVSASMVSRRLAAWAASVYRDTPPRVPDDVLDAAAACGDWNVMRWLHDDLRHPWTARTLVTAALYDQRKVFFRLLDDGTCPVDERAAGAALVGGGPALLEEALHRGCPRSPLLTTVAILLNKKHIVGSLLRQGHCDWLTNLCAVAVERTSFDGMTLNAIDYNRMTEWLTDSLHYAPPEYELAIWRVNLWAQIPNRLAWRVARGSVSLPPRTSPLVPDGLMSRRDPFMSWLFNQDDPPSSWRDDNGGSWGHYFALSYSLTERERAIRQPRPKHRQSTRDRQQRRYCARSRPGIRH
jgi:hypothetical protein